MKMTTLVCDCGCGATAVDYEQGGWLTLSQAKYLSSNDDPKLKEDLHFKNLNCLNSWTDKAVKAVPELQKAAGQLHARGSMVNKNVPGLYV